MPVISVIVPTYRRVPDLLRCLAALGRQGRPADQIVVVCREDDADSQAAVASSGGGAIALATVTEVGAVAAYNVGLDAAKGEIVVIIDDDTAPAEDWLDRIEQHYAVDAKLGGLGGRDVVHAGDTIIAASATKVGIIQLHGRIIGNHHIGRGAAREVHVLKGANMSFRAAALAGARFDRRLLGTGAQVGLEVGICAAVRRNGWRLVYDPAILVDHFPAVRHDEDARNAFSPLAQYNAAHNDTLAVLDLLPAWRRPVFLGWALALGTRASPGLLQAPRLAAQGVPNVAARLRASLSGRWAGVKTWWRTGAGRK
jgi:glycosyltransferase involved in cell wall biosynthesis